MGCTLRVFAAAVLCAVAVGCGNDDTESFPAHGGQGGSIGGQGGAPGGQGGSVGGQGGSVGGQGGSIGGQGGAVGGHGGIGGEAGAGGVASEQDCFDGIDNDSNGDTDCLDAACTTQCADPCAHPQPIADPETLQANTAGWGDAIDGSCVAGGGGTETVYAFTAATSGILHAKVTSFVDFALWVTSDCTDPSAEIACADQTQGAGDEEILLPVTAGQTLQIVVEASADGATGAYQLDVATVEDASCAAAISVADPSDTNGDTTGHNASLSACGNSGASPEQVYAVTAATTGVLDVTVHGQGSFDAVVYVRHVCADQQGNLGCRDATGPGGTETLAVPVVAGETYYVIVDGYNASAGAFTVHIASRVTVCGDGIREGQEQCDDGNTTPGDGCDGSCQIEECTSPTALADPATVQGDTTGGPTFLVSTCQPYANNGPERVYELVAAHTGVLDLELDATADLRLEVRTACGDPASAIGCKDTAVGGQPETLTVPVVQGQSYFVIVSSFNVAQFGPYQLSAATRTPICGDGHTDPPEQCDDGNTTAGDGCDATCHIELVTCANPVVIADPSQGVHTAVGQADSVTSCAPVGDLDMVFEVTAAQTGVLEASITGNGTIAMQATCGGGDLVCAAAGVLPLKTPVSAGDTVYIIVSRSTFDLTPFTLDVASRPIVCGDGQIDPPEQCDDGNTIPNDGCSPTCTIEGITETEPNDTAAQADAYSSPWGGIITSHDNDFVSVVVPGPSSTLTATVLAGPTTACAPPAAGHIDSELEILAPNGTTQLAFNDDIDVPTNWCSSATATNLAAGTYYVRVAASQQYCQACTFDYHLDVQVN